MNVAELVRKWERSELTGRSLEETAAYGWPADLGDEEILERLLAVNLERAGG